MRWRYRAISSASGTLLAGEMAAACAADVRASLRRSGLRPVRVAAVRSLALPHQMPGRAFLLRNVRIRRRAAKAELLDSLATMLGAGIALPDALHTLASTRNGARARIAARLHDAVHAGSTLAGAASREPAWFDHAEAAMLRAGEHSGELAPVLRALAERYHRAGQLAARITAALAYPALVASVGCGVVVFLSTQTLPQLVGVLEQARLPIPGLTRAVIAAGQALAGAWRWLPITALALAVLIAIFPALARRLRLDTRPLAEAASRLTPRALRDACLGAALLDLADLLRVGVPLTDSLRIVAPALAGLGAAPLRRRLQDAAIRIERGQSLHAALDDPRWFDPELAGLLAVAEHAGDLHAILHQIGESRDRRARRQVDRLTAILEPAVIIVLAALIGLVVMSAVLPMLRLQEVIG